MLDVTVLRKRSKGTLAALERLVSSFSDFNSNGDDHLTIDLIACSRGLNMLKPHLLKPSINAISSQSEKLPAIEKVRQRQSPCGGCNPPR